jgi:hypothetical protein
MAKPTNNSGCCGLNNRATEVLNLETVCLLRVCMICCYQFKLPSDNRPPLGILIFGFLFNYYFEPERFCNKA